MSERIDTPVAEQDRSDDFLSRWSRRKSAAQKDAVPDEPPVASEPLAEQEVAAPKDPGERIDPRTGKRYDELTDEDMPPLETLDESSDLSVFMVRNVSPALRTRALGKVFRSAKYNKVCQLCEYSGDYTKFQPLGDLITHDMKAAIAREAEKLRRRLLAVDQEISPEEAEARVRDEMLNRRKLAASAKSPSEAIPGTGSNLSEADPAESDRQSSRPPLRAVPHEVT